MEGPNSPSFMDTLTMWYVLGEVLHPPLPVAVAGPASLGVPVRPPCWLARPIPWRPPSGCPTSPSAHINIDHTRALQLLPWGAVAAPPLSPPSKPSQPSRGWRPLLHQGYTVTVASPGIPHHLLLPLAVVDRPYVPLRSPRSLTALSPPPPP